jgi:hypothetical protein
MRENQQRLEQDRERLLNVATLSDCFDQKETPTSLAGPESSYKGQSYPYAWRKDQPLEEARRSH